MVERDRPSRHGKLLGEALARMAAAGREASLFDLPDMCSTCAFREGCMTNQMASTGMAALNCALGVDADAFACHHGMKGGEPTRLCAGYLAAVAAPWSVTQEIMPLLKSALEGLDDGHDDVRAAFDAWRVSVDPLGEMNDHQLARMFNLAAKESSPA